MSWHIEPGLLEESVYLVHITSHPYRGNRRWTCYVVLCIVFLTWYIGSYRATFFAPYPDLQLVLSTISVATSRWFRGGWPRSTRYVKNQIKASFEVSWHGMNYRYTSATIRAARLQFTHVEKSSWWFIRKRRSHTGYELNLMLSSPIANSRPTAAIKNHLALNPPKYMKHTFTAYFYDLQNRIEPNLPRQPQAFGM